MKRILIIDDEKGICEIVKAGLEKMGDFEVNFAVNGEDGLRAVKNLMPDLILLDIRMHGMGGIEVLKILKDDEKTKAIPVIVLTALMDEIIRKELGSEYLGQYLEKPVELAVLKAKIEEELKKHGRI